MIFGQNFSKKSGVKGLTNLHHGLVKVRATSYRCLGCHDVASFAFNDAFTHLELNKNSYYCSIIRSSKHTEKCKWSGRAFWNCSFLYWQEKATSNFGIRYRAASFSCVVVLWRRRYMTILANLIQLHWNEVAGYSAIYRL